LAEIVPPLAGSEEPRVQITGATVRAEEPRVQFIHETVREYLRESGIGRLESSICNNPTGTSNDIIKTWCIEYMSFAARSYPCAEDLADTEPKPCSNSQSQICRVFPLLDYALSNFVAHAEEAQARGVSQASLLRSFPYDLVMRLSQLDDWHPRFISAALVGPERWIDPKDSSRPCPLWPALELILAFMALRYVNRGNIITIGEQ
jgi:hypothetical protein